MQTKNAKLLYYAKLYIKGDQPKPYFDFSKNAEKDDFAQLFF